MADNRKDVRRSLRTVRSSIKGRVHRSVYQRVDNICRLVEILLDRADQVGLDGPDLHLVTRTATDYLPSAIGPYLALPREFAERLPQADGRTAIQILCSQLDVMYARLWQVYDSVMRRDGDRLLAHERFLSDKFGDQEAGNPLRIPPDQPGARGRDGGSRRGRAGRPGPGGSEDWTAFEESIRDAARYVVRIIRSRRRR